MDSMNEDLASILAVVVTGHAKFHVGDNKFEARFIDVYAKRNGAWQMVAWQSTRLPD